MAHLATVSIGTPQRTGWGRPARSAIAKHAAPGPVQVTEAGLDGDRVANTKFHGGRDQAVYAYAREDLDWWGAELGRAIPDGGFGENLTTVGLDLNATVIGTRWRIGEALLEVCSIRTPCSTFQGWMGHQGYDDTRWVRRFTAARRPGPYLRVLSAGVIAAGDHIVVESVPTHGVTVVDMFEAMNLDRSRLPELAVIDDLAAEPSRLLARHLSSG